MSTVTILSEPAIVDGVLRIEIAVTTEIDGHVNTAIFVVVSSNGRDWSVNHFGLHSHEERERALQAVRVHAEKKRPLIQELVLKLPDSLS
jgi:hypothetical protein